MINHPCNFLQHGLRLCSLFFISYLAHAQAIDDINTAGEFEVRRDGGTYQSTLLLDTHIQGKVNGLVASIQVTQTFHNNSKHWANGRYVFPLPEGAAVDSLTITIGERVIEGVVKEKRQAKKVFEQAKREGKKAALLEQHRPNLFSLAVANIAPQSPIVTKITYIKRVTYDNKTFSLRLPTTLTPRYIPGTPLKQQVEHHLETERDIKIVSNGWAHNTPSVPDANDITPPQIHTKDIEQSEDKSSHRFTLDLTIDAGMPLSSLTSRTHQITRTSISNNAQKITLSNGSELMNSDVILQWQPTVGATPNAAIFRQRIADTEYSMIMFMPPNANTANTLPRDITFIIDSSGSMAGTSMSQAKASLLKALSTLTSKDHFNVIDFDSHFTPLFQNSMPATQSSLRQARNMINHLHADGGTEMMAPLEFVLTRQRSENTLNQIIFITDGSIGNEEALFELIHHKLGNARLFTVGIGSAPNAYFMRKAAKFGRGTYTYINHMDDAGEVMGTLFHKITHPVLRDIQIDWPGNVEHYPTRIPDLYLSEPLIVLAKSDQTLGKIKLSGSLLGKQWQRSLQQSTTPKNTDAQDDSVKENADNLNTLWAREKIAHLMDKMITQEISMEEAKPEITQLGITHQIVTRFTSFVAIEQQPSRPLDTKTKHQHVPNLMPKGNTMKAPQTATPATLMAIIGGLLMLFGYIGKHIRFNNLKAYTIRLLAPFTKNGVTV